MGHLVISIFMIYKDFVINVFSVGDPDLWDPYVFGLPGSVYMRYGSGSFCHKQK